MTPQVTVPEWLLADAEPDLYSQVQARPRVAVIVPYRETPDRVPLLRWVHRQWGAHHPDVEFILATDSPTGTGRWCKARAVAAGVAATDADVLIIHDADVWCDATMDAVRPVLAGEVQWAVPHQMVHRLKPRPTADILAGGPIVHEPWERKPYVGWEGGGIVVITRQAWETAPIDPRFQGWGQEDASWALALRAIVGHPCRGSAPLVHLWHEPQPRLTSEYGSAYSRWLWEQYVEAAGARDGGAAMRALIEEGRGA